MVIYQKSVPLSKFCIEKGKVLHIIDNDFIKMLINSLVTFYLSFIKSHYKEPLLGCQVVKILMAGPLAVFCL